MLKKTLLGLGLVASLACCVGCAGSNSNEKSSQAEPVKPKVEATAKVDDNLVLIKGGSFNMGSPTSENWRGKDELQHKVNVNDFYLSKYAVTQAEYEGVTGKNNSNFKGGNLPVENITWYEAIEFCNALSKKSGLEPVYEVKNQEVKWNRAANGYRLPTEAEWEYACRAGTTTPFYTPHAIAPAECNYYGHYPYEIEANYFNSEKLQTQPGEYRERTVNVNSFKPNPWGLYNMHGNVGEWVWDYYGAYDVNKADNPTGPAEGSLRVYRGGGWNDFGKHLRSAYRAAFSPNYRNFAVGLRLARNGNGKLQDTVVTKEIQMGSEPKKVLLAYYSWGGTTAGVARKIQAQAQVDVWEITMETPYSSSYHEVLMEAQAAQGRDDRPKLAKKVPYFDQYDTILLGYPNWWANIPMPVASFVEEYDFAGKTIIPFCSNGGGRFGQSISMLGKLAPKAKIGEGLTVHYSGGSSLPKDISNWLDANKVPKK